MSATPVPRQSLPLAWKASVLLASAWVLACCLWIVWADATVFEDVDTTFTAGLAAAIPVVVWLVTLLVALAGRYPAWWRFGLLVPAFIASTVALTWFHVPGHLGWALSRDAMRQAAITCDPSEPTWTGIALEGRRIGVYHFHSVQRLPNGGCHFRLLRNYPVVRTGFDHLPGETRDGLVDHTTYIPLGDSWHFYEWTE
ncbi:hypothetical protein ACIGO9_13060 [Nocardia asteroides]|uniref:hypothetical protein n=1 Tax=Nocardia asteroides TaxID=1824 RepID=UPI0037CC2B27